jgi:hypothetical protein
MQVIPYVREEHYEQVRGWLRLWKQDMPPTALPRNGFIIPGRAAIFLYLTDSSVAWIENLVAAPGLSREERSQAVDAVVTAAIDRARELGVEMLMAYTRLDAVVQRGARFGFMHVADGYHAVALPLKAPSVD